MYSPALWITCGEVRALREHEYSTTTAPQRECPLAKERPSYAHFTIDLSVILFIF